MTPTIRQLMISTGSREQKYSYVNHQTLSAWADENEQLRAALEGAKRHHLIVDDCWYSCPMSGECCNDELPKDKCTCGAEAHNSKVEAALNGNKI